MYYSNSSSILLGSYTLGELSPVGGYFRGEGVGEGLFTPPSCHNLSV